METEQKFQLNQFIFFYKKICVNLKAFLLPFVFWEYKITIGILHYAITKKMVVVIFWHPSKTGPIENITQSDILSFIFAGLFGNKPLLRKRRTSSTVVEDLSLFLYLSISLFLAISLFLWRFLTSGFWNDMIWPSCYFLHNPSAKEHWMLLRFFLESNTEVFL